MCLLFLTVISLLQSVVVADVCKDQSCGAGDGSAFIQRGLKPHAAGGSKGSSSEAYIDAAAGESCSSETLITSSDECETAAQATGWTYDGQGSSANKPYGCYWNSKNNFAKLNTNASAVLKSTNKNVGAICTGSSSTTGSTTGTSTTTSTTTKAVVYMEIPCSTLQSMCDYSIGASGVTTVSGCDSMGNWFATGCFNMYGYGGYYDNCTAVIVGQMERCSAALTVSPYYYSESDCEDSVCDDIYVIEKPSDYCTNVGAACSYALRYGPLSLWKYCPGVLYDFQTNCESSMGSAVCGASGDDDGNLMANLSTACYSAYVGNTFSISTCEETAGC